MNTEFHPAALQELIDSARYYESRLPGLGNRPNRLPRQQQPWLASVWRSMGKS